MPMMEYRNILLTTQTLTGGQVITTRLPSQMGWVGLNFRVAGTFTTAGTALVLDGTLNLLSRIQLRINGRPLFDLPGPDCYFRHTFWNRTAGARLETTASGGSSVEWNWGFTVPLALPFPTGSPQKFGTILPAGLVNTIELQLTPPQTLTSAVFSTGSPVVGSGPTVTVTAIALDLSNQELIDLVKGGGDAYIQTGYLQTLGSTGDLDLDLQGGRGILKDFFADYRNNSLHITSPFAAFISNVRLLIGNNQFPVDSTYLQLQDRSKEIYMLEGTAGQTVNPSGGVDYPAGCYMYSFVQEGQYNEGVKLDGQPSVKLRSTVTSSPTSATNTVITGVLMPNWYQEVL